MKEKLKNKKIVYTIIGIVSILLVALALTYAYWLLTKEQTGENVISSACLDIEITGEKNDIELGSQYPISDEEGEKLIPYEFTVTNKCDTAVDYQIALEIMPNADDKETLSSSALKVMFDETDAKTLDKYSEIEATINNATSSNKLMLGTLGAAGSSDASATHKLRLWIDANAPIAEANKTYTGKISVTVGQTINNTIRKGSLAYNILSNYGGEEEIKILNNDKFSIVNGESFEVKSCEKQSSSGNIIVCRPSNEITLDLYESYNMSDDGEITFSNKVATATMAECLNETYDCEKYYIPIWFDEDSMMASGFVSAYTSSAEGANGVGQIPENSTIYEDTCNDNNGERFCMCMGSIPLTVYYYGCITKTEEIKYDGMYKAEDDLGDSYYFRGEVEDNYVKFGKWSNESSTNAGKDMYWRIVRINGDGTIRLAYDGTEKVKNGVVHDATIGTSAYYSYSSNLNYPGYMYSESDPYGNELDSEVKTLLDSWYTNNLETTYGKYIADSIFCNDREIESQNEWQVRFKSYNRLSSSGELSPNLTCAQKADRFTVSNNNGNKALSKPVGLITADEIVFAGLPSGYASDGNRLYNSTFYLAKSGEYWTMTPNNYGLAYNTCETQAYFVSDTFNASANTILVDNDVMIDGAAASRGVRPVINLRADVKFTGNGTYDTPYEIVMN